MKKRGRLRKGLAILLTAAMVVGLVPGMGTMQVSATESDKNTVNTVSSNDTMTQNQTVGQATDKLITTWQWIDEEEYLDEETGNLALPGANKDNPAYFDDVTAFLPTQIQATVVNADNSENPETGVEEPITLGDWSCDNYPEDGAYSGSYTFTVTLPEGYTLSGEAKALTVLVELGGAQMWYNSGSFGNEVYWELDDYGTLFIMGEGDIPDVNLWGDVQATSVKEIVIQEGVTGIGNMCLSSCTNLTSVTIPSSVTSIGESAFNNCESLTTVSFAEECSSTLSIGNGAFYYCTALESIEIPDYVTTLGSQAFAYCKSLQSVTFKEGSQLNTISDYAFYGCSALTFIVIPESVESIGNSIFGNCSNLNKVACVSRSSAESYLSSNYPDISIVLYKIKLDLGSTGGYTITQADKTALPGSGLLLTDGDGSLSFRIEAAYGYNKNFTVKADGTEMTAVDGVYTISGITENKTIALTIEGAGACSHNYNNGFCTKCDAYEPAVYNESQNYYEINNAGQLYWFAGLVNGDENICTGSVTKNTSANAVLTADITVNSGLTEDKGLLQSLSYDSDGNVINGDSFRSWTPIGNDSNSYTGTFDGQGFTVSGLYFNNTDSNTGKKVGLFGCVGSGGKVSKVGVVDSYFNAYRFVGDVCGWNYGGNITECYNKGTVNGNDRYIGGVCGDNNSGTIQNCYNEGTVTGKDQRIGGVCGYNDKATIINCYNTGKVAGRTGCGGVCGNNYTAGTIQNCYNIGTVSFSTTDTTGAIGGVCGYNKSTITNCYFDSDKYTGIAVGTPDEGSNVSGNVLGKTTEQFNSGEVAYLLNGSSSENSIWYQNIDNGTEDAYPVLDSGHGIVYQCTNCIGTYSNTKNKSAAHSFKMMDDTNHKCKNCGLEAEHSTATLTYTADEDTKKITVECGDDCGKEYGTVTLSAPTEDLTYDGNAKTASVTNNVTGVTISEPTITYSKPGDATFSGTPKDAGTYTASITLGDGDGAATVSVEFTIGKATPELGTVSVTPLSDTLNTNQVVFNRTNSTVAGTFALTDVTELQYGTHDYSYVFTPTGDDAVNYKPVEGTVSITVNDTIAPTAEYQIGENGWKKFVNTVSFGLFCKDYKTVEIKYSDVNASNEPGSGVKTEQYYIANKELTEDEVADLQWKNYSDTISLNAEGVYFIYVKMEDNAGNSVVLNSEGIVIYAESTLSPTSMDYTYKENKDLEVQITLNGNTFVKLTDGEGTEIATSNYEIDASGKLTLKKAYLDTLDVGQYTYKVSMNPQGQTTDAVTLTYSFVVNVKAQELTVTGATATSRVYDTTKAVAITAVELSGIRSGEVVSVDTTNLTGTLTGANAGSYTSVNLPALTLTGADAGNYRLVQPTDAVSTTVTISKADAQITVDTGKDSYSKTFGDVAFPLSGISDTNTEANVQYAVTEGEDVVSVSNGTVTIKKAGAAKITVSLPASTNYNAAEDKTITVTVAKNGNYSVEEVNRSYLYSRNNTENIDLSGYLPADCGNVTYGELLKNGDLYTDGGQPTVSDDGKLSYTVKQAETSGATGTIQVTVTTENYADFTITVNVKLTDKLLVKLKDGSSVTLQNSTLTYGQALSTLSFNSAEFVDDGGKVVTGNLAWKTPDGKPKVGTTSATWVFTPEDEAYEAVEDTVGITVNKATPNVTALPTVAERTYHPTVSLTDTDLVGGTVNVAGSWNWQKANLIPTVNNSGYVAVFTPEDSTNYETVTRAITVTVTKATPYIKTAPTAAAVTYGDTLGASMLSGGTVQYSTSDETTVVGSFTWKDSSVKPSVSDSGTTAYRIVFNPSDAENYNTAETGITLTVNKAENAPNMPSSTMNVANSCTKVSDVTLPTGWVWQDADQNTALTVDTPVTVTAVYNGADAGNYVKKTVSVTITRSALNNGGGSSSGGSSGGGNNGGGSSSGGSSSGGNNGGNSSTGGSSGGGNSGGNSSTGGSSGGGTEAGTGDQSENSGNTTTITNGDGSTTTTKTETDTNGNTITTSTTVAADGSSTEKVQATATNTAGKEVAVTTTTKTDADGNVTSVTEKSVIADITKDTTATITVKTGGDGKVTSAKASITKTSDSTKVSLSGKVLDQITEAAGADVNVRVSMTVKDNDGKTKYTVQADVNEVIPGKKLYIYKLDTKTGKYTMVDDKKYEVTKAGTVTVNMTKKATYELVTAEESKVITKEILATVKPAKKSKSLPVKNTTTFKLSDMLDMDNIKRITYATSKKSVATITKKGTIKAVKAGTATVKATVTLKNGTKKTIKMTIKVK